VAERPWIVDTWVNLLRPVAGHARDAGENVFGRYGSAEWLREGTRIEALLAEMDATGVAVAGLTSTEFEAVAEAVSAHPTRFFGILSPDPTDIMACLRSIERAVVGHGFKAVKIEPFLWNKPPTDRMYYPIYAKCVELDVTFTTQIGHTGPLYPSEGHIGWPWHDEAIALAWKHANLWIDTSAHVPKHFPPTFTHFVRTSGRDKCLFASDWPLLPIARPLAELDAHCALPDDVKRKFLRENALRAFKLDL
jgi:uncharacterized protein